MEVLDGNSKTTKTKVLGVGNAGKCTESKERIFQEEKISSSQEQGTCC